MRDLLDVELMVDRIVDYTDFTGRVRKLVEQLAEHPGSAVVSTAELTPQQIDAARRSNRLVVRFDGLGFALMFGWKRRRNL